MELISNPIFILFTSFVIFLLIRMPIAVALALSSLTTVLMDGGSLTVVVQRLYAGTQNWVLMAIPFFMLAGEIMEAGGVTKRIVNFANAIFGFLPGGLAAVNVGASMIMGGISGSAVADASAIGNLLIPSMKKQGYDVGFASAVTASSAPIGMIIPPSIPMVMWSFVSGVSLSALFIGGIIPGILVGLSQIGISTFISVRRGYKANSKFSLKNVAVNGKDGFLALLAPIIIIGGIVTGIFTPTEAAIVAVVYTMFLAMGVYKEMKISDLPRVILKSGYTTAVVMFIVASAGIFSWIMSYNDIPQAITKAIMSVVHTPGQFMLLACGLLFILGMFMDVGVIIILVGPLLAPMVTKMGVDPIGGAMVFMIILASGLITPPVGLCLFVASGISKITIERIAKESLPFLIGFLVIAALLWFIPGLTLWLPSMLVH